MPLARASALAIRSLSASPLGSGGPECETRAPHLGEVESCSLGERSRFAAAISSGDMLATSYVDSKTLVGGIERERAINSTIPWPAHRDKMPGRQGPRVIKGGCRFSRSGPGARRRGKLHRPLGGSSFEGSMHRPRGGSSGRAALAGASGALTGASAYRCTFNHLIVKLFDIK